MRAVLLILGLMLIVGVTFAIWGDQFESLLTGESLADFFKQAGPYAGWVAVGLLSADIVFPLPGTAIMSGLGIIYGPFWGGIIAAAGSFLAGMLGYGVGRIAPRPVVGCVLGVKDYRRTRRFFQRAGGWAVAWSRWLPILPETVAVIAGLARMRPAVYCLALACGSIPMGFAYAAVGAMGADHPLLALSIAAILPLLIWPIGRIWIKRSESSGSRKS